MNTLGMTLRSGCVGLLALMLGLIASCSLYDEAYRTRPLDGAAQTSADYTLKYIESDDRGWFWDPAQANDALSLVQSATSQGDTLVLLFIHGWHHSAACYDDNLEAFKRVLTNLRAELGNQMYQTARGLVNYPATPKPVTIVGIYVGWRGRSLPGLLDYSTFWGRKSTAQRVGQGDLQEFMARLQWLYDDHARGPQQNGKPPPFFGLVSIGHSFGGAVLLTSTARYFESELELANPQTGFLHQQPKDAPVSDAASQKAPGALRGFGDLVVLVNPAIEAAAYERINALSRSMTYSPTQAPVLVTFSATNDAPRRGLFTAGRAAGEVFTNAAPIDDERERAAEHQALGVYDFAATGVTHTLTPTEKHTLVATQFSANPDPLCGDETPGRFNWWTWKDAGGDAAASAGAKGAFADDTLNVEQQFTPALASTVAKYDFSQDLRFAQVKLEHALTPGTQTPRPYTPYQPFMVVAVDPQIIDGHNGIFSAPFMDFLLRYIGFVEAKRYLLTQQPALVRHDAAP